MNELKLQRQANIVRQCLRAALLQNDRRAARRYRLQLLKAEALAALRQARLAEEVDQATFEIDINPW